MESQLKFWPEAQTNSKGKYMAIYFCMGHYNQDDGLPELVGYDCPFGGDDPRTDSPEIRANDISKLKKLVESVYHDGLLGPDYTQTLPEIIVDEEGKIRPDIYQIVTGYELNPEKKVYSSGRESLIELWSREKWRWNFDD